MEPERIASFQAQFTELYEAHFGRIHRYLNRLSGDRDLALDIAQETFVRLYRRGSLPERPDAWLISVAMNLFRNAASGRSRRARLLTPARGLNVLADPPASPQEAVESEDARRRVRSALDRMPERERSLLLLQAEGYGYRDIAEVLKLNPASVGTLLARARQRFRECYEESIGES